MLQWAVTLGRIDVHQSVVCMSCFKAQPRKGHLMADARIFGHLSNHKTASVMFRTKMPDCLKFMKEQETAFDWSHMCGKLKESVPKGLSEPDGSSVRATFFIDANFGHDKVTRRSCSGILTIMNLTPIDRLSKLQNKVETAACGSEFCGVRQTIDKILAERCKSCAPGVPLDGPACMFGDNKSAVLSSTIPD